MRSMAVVADHLWRWRAWFPVLFAAVLALCPLSTDAGK